MDYKVDLRVRDKVRVLGFEHLGNGLGEILPSIPRQGDIFNVLINGLSGGSYINKSHLTLIPTEKDIVVGSVWEDKWSATKRTVTFAGKHEIFTDSVYHSDFRWNNASDFLARHKLIHRGEEEVGEVDRQCKEIVSVFKLDINDYTKQKEKKMKTKVISTGQEIIDDACKNIGKVVHYDEELGEVVYKEVDKTGASCGNLTIGHIDNIYVSPVKVVMPKPEKKKGKKK